MRKSILAVAVLSTALALSSGLEAQTKKAGKKSIPATKLQPAQSTVTRISGTLPDNSFDGEEVIFARAVADGTDTIAKAVIKGNKFAFAESFPNDVTSLNELRLKRKYRTSIILEGGNLKADLSKPSATGTPLNDYFAKFIDEMMAYKSEKMKEIEALDDNDPKAETLYNAYLAGMLSKYEGLFNANKDNVLGIRAATFLFGGNNGATDAQIDKWRAEATPIILQNASVASSLKIVDAARATAAGKKFVDIVGPNIKDEQVRLSDIAGRGHYTLVDFWASWCGPCRRSMPALKALYKEYKPKGLEIVGVAVWDKRDKHLEAVEKEGLPWTQIFNYDEAGTAYGITGIPHIMLIGPDGTIVARDLHEVNKIKEILAAELQKNGGKL